MTSGAGDQAVGYLTVRSNPGATHRYACSFDPHWAGFDANALQSGKYPLYTRAQDAAGEDDLRSAAKDLADAVEKYWKTPTAHVCKIATSEIKRVRSALTSSPPTTPMNPDAHDIGSVYEQAEAWETIVKMLDELSPWWNVSDNKHTGTNLACVNIRRLLTHATSMSVGGVAEDKLWKLLPNDASYLDPPDGGNVPLIEQLQRMADDAHKWRERAAKPAQVGQKYRAVMIEDAQRLLANAPDEWFLAGPKRALNALKAIGAVVPAQEGGV